LIKRRIKTKIQAKKITKHQMDKYLLLIEGLKRKGIKKSLKTLKKNLKIALH
jgi:hypothetical protein